ncbi:gamma-glutamyltransferase family protein [Bryobacter aggregatus]|uniref:gamma-glutamyltransferase family protein n=1 Tax=Bryobacter aggregatus TaxID=360054 RepID=UPI00138E50D9|nr:gamma-glutamyltransferase family protein [Bryobacter aggregatus]
MRRPIALLILIALLLACGTAQQTIQTRDLADALLPKEPARGKNGAVAGGTAAAVDAGMKIFKMGGNAVDAGVATMFAAAVAEYSHFGFGGEAPILIRTKDGTVVTIGGVGTMPKLGTPEFFRKHQLEPLEVDSNEPNGLTKYLPVTGLLPAIVPGMVEGGLVALRDYGTLSFEQVIGPAIELADEQVVDDMRAAVVRYARPFFDRWPTSKAYFMPDGHMPRPGETFKQPALAKTLRAMVAAEQRAAALKKPRTLGIDAVRDYFYRGEIARKIDAFSKANGGLIRYEDMANFRVKPEPSLGGSYKNYTVYKPGFYTQGPAAIELLNLMENTNVAKLGFGSEQYIHTMTEAMKLAYADRDAYYGDPLFTKVPSAELLSKEYAKTRFSLITDAASLDFRPGKVKHANGTHPSREELVRRQIDDALMYGDTTCVNAIDKDGVLFSATPSGAALPSVIVGDTGIPLTQRAQSFYLIGDHPNDVAPGKRPRVTLTPTLVLKDGKPYMVMSTPGGDNQDQSLVQMFFNVVEFGMNAQQAVAAPRFQSRHLVSSFDNHAMNPGSLLVDERFGRPVAIALKNRGHRVEFRSRFSSGAAPTMILLQPDGTIEAGADPYAFRVAKAF